MPRRLLKLHHHVALLRFCGWWLSQRVRMALGFDEALQQLVLRCVPYQLVI